MLKYYLNHTHSRKEISFKLVEQAGMETMDSQLSLYHTTSLANYNHLGKTSATFSPEGCHKPFSPPSSLPKPPTPSLPIYLEKQYDTGERTLDVGGATAKDGEEHRLWSQRGSRIWILTLTVQLTVLCSSFLSVKLG